MAAPQPARQFVDLVGAAPAREYTLALHTTDDQDHYKYVADGPIDLRAGDRVTFELTNTGQFPHDLVVVDPAGNAMAKADPVNPGGTLDLTVDFTEAGFYRLRCNFGNHLTQHDMQVVVEVKQADGTSA